MRIYAFLETMKKSDVAFAPVYESSVNLKLSEGQGIECACVLEAISSPDHSAVCGDCACDCACNCACISSVCGVC